MSRKKICFVVAVPGTAHAFLKDHIAALSQKYDVYLAANISCDEDVADLNVAGYYAFPIMRTISILNDIKAAIKLASYFKKMKFDAVHSVTPKAGFITALAARIAGIKNRIHIFTGQVWATRKGMSRLLLKSLDKFIAVADSKILVDGKSQQQFLIAQGVISSKKSHVIGDGSISGVNTARFSPSDDMRRYVRKELGITDGKTVFVFMGRLNHDKGLHELLPAFNRLAESYKDAFLLLFGNDEENIASEFSKYENLNKDNFLYYGATKEPQKMMQAGDVFVLPTHREGFGSSVIEAACLGLPTITSDAYGVLDASVPGETGLQCKVGDVDSLYEVMRILADDESMRKQMGLAGRQRVLEHFSGEVVIGHWVKFYDELLK